jgi:hypothetical protein
MNRAMHYMIPRNFARCKILEVETPEVLLAILSVDLLDIAPTDREAQRRNPRDPSRTIINPWRTRRFRTSKGGLTKHLTFDIFAPQSRSSFFLFHPLSRG